MSRDCRISPSVFDVLDHALMMDEIRELIAARRQFAVSFDSFGTATLSSAPEQKNQPGAA